MSPELDRALCERYPLIFRDRYASMRATLMCWGFSCGDGWYTLIDTACALMYAAFASARDDYEFARSEEGKFSGALDVFVDAVTVERARLVMSSEADRVPVAIQVKEKYGSLRFYVANGSERIYTVLEFAELMSESMCELCGRPALVREVGGWYRTRCEEHEATLQQGG